MRVLFVSPEIYPLAKTGGLADVSAALPLALAALGCDVRVVLPGYPKAIEAAVDKASPIDLAGICVAGAGPVRVIAARTPDTKLPIWLVDCPALFERPGGPYQDEHGSDWPDNARRFALFCHVAARLALGDAASGWRADVVHANDWHTGLLPMLLSARGADRPATVFTLHNLAFQGLFSPALAPELGIPASALGVDGMEFYGNMSFLKAGIRYSDQLTTVSPSYAREILTPAYGCGLDGLLRERADDLAGRAHHPHDVGGREGGDLDVPIEGHVDGGGRAVEHQIVDGVGDDAGHRATDDVRAGHDQGQRRRVVGRSQ